MIIGPWVGAGKSNPTTLVSSAKDVPRHVGRKCSNKRDLRGPSSPLHNLLFGVFVGQLCSCNLWCRECGNGCGLWSSRHFALPQFERSRNTQPWSCPWQGGRGNATGETLLRETTTEPSE